MDAGLVVPGLNRTQYASDDEPMVDTPRDAVAAFRRMPLHALAMPPFWIRKQIDPELPE